MESSALNFKELKKLYGQQVNIMRLFRECTGADSNSTEAVLVAYDLQSGSYRRALENPGQRARFDAYTGAMAAVLDTLDFDSLLDAGTGEATTLCALLSLLRRRPARAAGFDLAWSRVAHGREHARGFPGAAPDLFTGDIFHIPVADAAFDCVFTSHALEPNYGREREALAELARVARRWIVLFEPSYELGDDDTRRHIEEFRYVRALPDAARAAGLEVAHHALLSACISPRNQTAALVLRKPGTPAPAPAPWLGCPLCHAPLAPLKSHLFCAGDGLVFPILDGIPALLPANGVLASHFASSTL